MFGQKKNSRLIEPIAKYQRGKDISQRTKVGKFLHPVQYSRAAPEDQNLTMINQFYNADYRQDLQNNGFATARAQQRFNKRVSRRYAKGLTDDKKTQLQNEGIVTDVDNENFSWTNEDDNADFKAYKEQALADRQQRGQNMQSAASTFSNIANTLSSASGVEHSELSQKINAGIDAAADVVGQAFPAVKLINEARKASLAAMDAVGLNTDNVTKAEQIFAENDPLMRTINSAFTQKLDKFAIDQETMSQVGASYGGTYSDMQDAENLSGKTVGLLGAREAKKLNRQIAKANHQQAQIQSIAKEAREQQELVDFMGDQALVANDFNNSGGYSQMTHSAKEGGIFTPIITTWHDMINFVPNINLYVPKISLDLNDTQVSPANINMMKAGGRLLKELDPPEIESTEQKNIIPEGSMHKSYHHMENMKGCTKKGIPVLSTIDGMQAAEIEREEIIFSKEVTSKLEELYNIYFDEEVFEAEKIKAALDAGKLLTTEIMCNTDDRTGLIDTLQKGGNVGVAAEIAEELQHKIDEEDAEAELQARIDYEVAKKIQAGAKQSDTVKPSVSQTSNVDATQNKISSSNQALKQKLPFDEWVESLSLEAKKIIEDELDGDYDIKTAYKIYPIERINNWIDARLHPEAWEDRPIEDWHLGSVYVDEYTGDWMFLKKGFNVLQNPELGFQFQEMLSMPYRDLQRLLTNKMMRFDKDNNRWVLVNREEGTSVQDDIYMLESLMCGVTQMPEQTNGWQKKFIKQLMDNGALFKQKIDPNWFL